MTVLTRTYIRQFASNILNVAPH